MKAGVDGILGAAQAAGGGIPNALKPAIDDLLAMKGLTDDERLALTTLRDTGPDFNALEQTAAKYGITLAGLGPTFQQAHLDRTAQGIFKDFTALTDAGGDVGGVLFGMSDEISGLVQESQKFGTAIPENFKPLLQNLVDAGRLTDEQGGKIKDLTGIKFEDTPLDKGTSAIVDAIDRLGKLLGGLPGIAKDAATGIGTELGKVHVPTIGLHYRADVDEGARRLRVEK